MKVFFLTLFLLTFSFSLHASLPGLEAGEAPAEEIPALGPTKDDVTDKKAPPVAPTVRECPFNQITSQNYPGYDVKTCWRPGLCALPFTIRHFLIASCREKGDGAITGYAGPSEGTYFNQLGIDGVDFSCTHGLFMGDALFHVHDPARFPFLDLGARLEDSFANADIYEKTQSVFISFKKGFPKSARIDPLCRNAPLEGEGFSDGIMKLLNDKGKITLQTSLEKTVFYQPNLTTTLHTFYRKNWERQCKGVIFPGIDDRSRHGKYVIDKNGLLKTIDYYCCGVQIGWHWEADQDYGVALFPHDITDLYPGANTLTPGAKKGIGHYIAMKLSDGSILKKMEDEHLKSHGDAYHFIMQNAFLACRDFARQAFTKLPDPEDERWKSHEK